jgi:hypothetical protein
MAISQLRVDAESKLKLLEPPDHEESDQVFNNSLQKVCGQQCNAKNMQEFHKTVCLQCKKHAGVS